MSTHIGFQERGAACGDHPANGGVKPVPVGHILEQGAAWVGLALHGRHHDQTMARRRIQGRPQQAHERDEARHDRGEDCAEPKEPF